MKYTTDMPVITIANDLDALIKEIEKNPHLSSWVIRLTLKSIKEKAEKIAIDEERAKAHEQLVCHN